LEWNSVGIYESGVSELAAGIRANSTLKELDLRNNKITPEGAHILANALKTNDKLSSVGMLYWMLLTSFQIYGGIRSM
jgi:Ran GTPase-activating protein (RanGAP) involved in mRNA processing and transport